MEKNGDEEQTQPDMSKGCVDENNECAIWAKSGECEKNPNYMSSFCRRSCKTCKAEIRWSDEGDEKDEL